MLNMKFQDQTVSEKIGWDIRTDMRVILEHFLTLPKEKMYIIEPLSFKP